MKLPVGYKTLNATCLNIYSKVPNLETFWSEPSVKYWQGGHDPLDYIIIYSNPGNQNSGIEPHWHYVGFGLSDLYGDGRVHKRSGSNMPSGYGFELTFRLKREPCDQMPPRWPARIMQDLARRVFKSGNSFCAGHTASLDSKSRIQHVLIFEDPQLGTVEVEFGRVTFLQIVRVLPEELEAAQGGNGPDIIKYMKSIKDAGGPWLVTDMRRSKTVFEVDPSVQENFKSDECCVTAGCRLRKSPKPMKSQSSELCETVAENSVHSFFFNLFTAW